MGQRWRHHNLGSKDQRSRSRWNNVCWNHHCTCGGIQYLTSRVEYLDFLVTITVIHYHSPCYVHLSHYIEYYYYCYLRGSHRITICFAPNSSSTAPQFSSFLQIITLTDVEAFYWQKSCRRAFNGVNWHWQASHNQVNRLFFLVPLKVSCWLSWPNLDERHKQPRNAAFSSHDSIARSSSFAFVATRGSKVHANVAPYSISPADAGFRTVVSNVCGLATKRILVHFEVKK